MMIAAVVLSLAIGATMVFYIGFFAGTIHGGRLARQDLDRGQNLRERVEDLVAVDLVKGDLVKVEPPWPGPRKGPDCKGD
jgi:hypothetical protein